MNNNALINPGIQLHDAAWGRWVKTLPLAAITTAALLVFMERLITAEPMQAPELVEYVVPEIVLDVKEPQVQRSTKAEKPKAPDPVPEFTPEKLQLDTDLNSTVVARFTPSEPAKPQLGNFASNVPIATVLVQPDYPRRAALHGIEGYVDVQFDVTATGATTNIQVLAAHPERYFEDAARKAVKNWKYSPVVKDGKPQVYQGMQQRLVFTLADA